MWACDARECLLVMKSIVYAWRHWRGRCFYWDRNQERRGEREVSSNLKYLRSPSPVAVRMFMYVCCWWSFLCGKAALTRSPKHISLVVKGVRSHCAFSLIHTDLARTVPMVESTWLGNIKLRHQLPGSHYGGQGRTQPNWITLSLSHVGIRVFVCHICKDWHTHSHIYTHALWKQSVIHPGGFLSQQGTVTVVYRRDTLSARNRSVAYDWLTHTSIWLLNRLICAVNSCSVPFSCPMGVGDNLTFIEILL